jgi:hypothetical protein
MGGVFWAFSQQDIDAMTKNSQLMNEFVDWEAEEKKYAFDLDILDSWNLFIEMFGEIVFPMRRCSPNNCFEFGCVLLDANFVKRASAELSCWTHEAVLKAVQNFNEKDEIYHLESLKADNSERVLEQFDCLAAFYKKAAEQGLGAVFAIM